MKVVCGKYNDKKQDYDQVYNESVNEDTDIGHQDDGTKYVKINF